MIGQPTAVQVSSTHNYHAVSMIRGLLGVGFEPVRVSASRFTAPLVDPLSRTGWTGNDTPKEAATTLATLDFGGASGLYDFTDNQWHNQLRLRRIVVRGSHGEIADDTVVRLAGKRTILKSSLTRSQLGYDLNLDGYDTEHISFEGDVLYRNPYLRSQAHGRRDRTDVAADSHWRVGSRRRSGTVSLGTGLPGSSHRPCDRRVSSDGSPHRHRRRAMGPLVQEKITLFSRETSYGSGSEFLLRGNTRDAVCFTVFRESGRGR